MLRASARTTGDDIDLAGIVAGNAVATGIPGDKALLAFAEESLGDGTQAIAEARRRVLEELGEPSLIDAAGVIANFQRMVRIADATGIPLDGYVAALTADLRDALGINAYGTARLAPEPSVLSRK